MADLSVPESQNERVPDEGENQQVPSNAKTGSGEGKPPDKTISCVSCRKRKLKCDRIKPKCGTCSRLRHDCEYPERRRNLGSKRRNMKELEARLAQVETQLVSEQKSTNQQPSAAADIDTDWDALGMDMNIDMGSGGLMGSAFDVGQGSYDFQPSSTAIPADNIFPQELIELGLQEPLPPQEMMDELHQIYFDKFHTNIPMMHKYRYLASLDRSPMMRPPVCLRYAMWTMAASLSDKYTCYEDLLYERARRYIQAAEMKGFGEAFVSVYHAQTWSLIATYEAKKTYFSRAWMSTGRTVRLTQMLGLYRLDSPGLEVKQILPPAKDWIELEERRRTFWAAFYGDRWASAGTGWPMLIDESQILTNLPASEESFESGLIEPTVSLAEALTPEGAGSISPFGGVILSATLFGHNFQHLHKTGPDERPDDLANGEFWKRHRKMDNVLSNTFMFLPDQLRLPGGLRDMNVVFLHMNIHASVICLHQAACLAAERNNCGINAIRQSQTRSLMAAEEIANIMRLVCHVHASKMSSWVGFCLYVAAGVFLKDQKTAQPHPQSMSNLEFLVAAMQAIGNTHHVTKHFTAQLEIDISSAGIRNTVAGITPKKHGEVPTIPMNGLLVDRNGLPMTVDDLQNFARASNIHETGGIREDHSDKSGSQIPLNSYIQGHLSTGSRSNSSGASPSGNAASPHTSNILWAFGLGGGGGDSDPTRASINSESPSVENGQAQGPGNSSNKATPSSDSSSSNTMQFPYRQADTTTQSRNDRPLVVCPWADSSTGLTPAPAEWNVPEEFDDLDTMLGQDMMPSEELRPFFQVASGVWDPNGVKDRNN